MVSINMKILFLVCLFVPLVSSEEVVSDIANKLTKTIHDENPTVLEHPEQRFPELNHDLEQKLRAQIWSDTKHHKKNTKAAPQAEQDNRPAMPNEDEADRYPTLNEDLEAKLRLQLWSDTKHHKKASETKRLRGSN